MKFDENCAGCFAGLSCGIRVEIVNLLERNKKMAVLQIAKHFKVTQPTVTHHLKYLKDAGILKSQRQGRQIFYFLDPKCKDQCGVFN